MITDEQQRDDLAAYAAAFDDDMAAPREAEAPGGVTPPTEDAPASGDGETFGGEPAAVVLAIADGNELERAEGEVTADATTTSADEDLGSQGGEPAGEEIADPKELQRIRSWEGRLRAREAELARKEAELAKTKPEGGEEPGEGQSEGLERAAETLEQQGNTEGAEAVENVAERVESGELSAADAMKILAEDFGPEFVKMIKAIAGSEAQEAAGRVAKEATGQLGQTVEQIIGSIADDSERRHFEAIADKHEDFMDVTSTPEFEAFAKQYPDGERIVDSGSAREIIKLLDKFKASQKAPEPEAPNPAIEAAEGVRSGGLRIPEAPKRAEGYEDAWESF